MMDEQQQSVTQAVKPAPYPGERTVEEARCFYQGYIAGLTAYARERGDSTLKRDNQLLRTLMEKVGWDTIEKYEAISNLEQEHGQST